jgi:hypothetical protein
MPVFRDYSQTNRTTENALLLIECRNILAFLQRANVQSGFEQGVKRMQCDQKVRFRPERLDFAGILEQSSALRTSAFYGTYVSVSHSGSLGVEKSLELYKRIQS